MIYIARETGCRLVSLNICLQITNKSLSKSNEGFYIMRRKIVNVMPPITCMSVFLLLLLLFCYETVKCAGVSRQYGKKASRTVKLNTNFNSTSDQTHGKNVSIVRNCKVPDLKETKKKWWQPKSIRKIHIQ